MSVPTIPIQEWDYPDSLDKMLMNDLILNSSLSEAYYSQTELQYAVRYLLDAFVDWGYVTMTEEFDAVADRDWRVYRVTPFFQEMMAEYYERQKDLEEIKWALWEEKQRLLNQRRPMLNKMSTKASKTRARNEIHDKILELKAKLIKGKMVPVWGENF